MRNYKNLAVWTNARVLVMQVYRVTASFPAHEQFGLTSQLRRAAVSVAANIAEGCGRDTDADKARFLTIASGSASEVMCFAGLSHDVGFLEGAEATKIEVSADEIQRMLYGLIKAMKA